MEASAWAEASFLKDLGLLKDLAQNVIIVALGWRNMAIAGDYLALTPHNMALSQFFWR